MKNLDISRIGTVPDDAYLSAKIIAAITGNGISTIWRYSATDPTFPRPIKLSARCTRFRAGDVRAWLASKETPGK